MVKSKSRVTDILGSKTRPIMIGSYNIAYLELFFCSYNHLYIHQTGLYPVFGKPKFLQRKKLQASSIQRKKKETEEAANYPGFYLHRIIGSQNIKKNNGVLILATRFSKPSKITCIVKTRLSYWFLRLACRRKFEILMNEMLTNVFVFCQHSVLLFKVLSFYLFC